MTDVEFSLPLWLVLFGAGLLVTALLTAVLWWALRDPPELRAGLGRQRRPGDSTDRSASQARSADNFPYSAPDVSARSQEVHVTASDSAGRGTGPDSRAADPYAGLPDDHLLAPPPTVTTVGGEVVVTEWLRHHAGGESLLMEVVEEMYRRAAGVPAVADYFGGADLATLPRHFHATLSVVASRGLTVGLARRMAAAHGHVRNSAGQPITVEVFDAVVATLAGILAERGVPEPTLRQVAAVVAPLRVVIAVDPTPVRA